MTVCPKCRKKKFVFVSAHAQLYDDGTVDIVGQYWCLHCSEAWLEYDTLEDGTDDDTRPSHDNSG